MLTITGFIFFIIFIWFRFIRGRLPRDIPFIFNLFGFFSTLFILITFIFIIYSLIKTKYKSNIMTQEIFKTGLNIIYIPLEHLDNFIKDYCLKKFNYKNGIIFLAKQMEYFVVKTNYYYYIFVFIPKIVLISIFIFDVFYCHKLLYIYKAMFLSIFFLIDKYIFYNYKKLKEDLIINLEKDLKEKSITVIFIEELFEIIRQESKNTNPDHDEEEWENCPTDVYININLRLFIEYQSKYYGKTVNHILFFSETYKIIFCEQEGITSNQFQQNYLNYKKKIDLYLEAQLENILSISYVIHHYNLINNSTTNIKILIYISYAFCWLFILIVSIHTLNIHDLLAILKESWLNVMEPFSGNNLLDNEK